MTEALNAPLSIGGPVNSDRYCANFIVAALRANKWASQGYWQAGNPPSPKPWNPGASQLKVLGGGIAATFRKTGPEYLMIHVPPQNGVWRSRRTIKLEESRYKIILHGLNKERLCCRRCMDDPRHQHQRHRDCTLSEIITGKGDVFSPESMTVNRRRGYDWKHEKAALILAECICT